MDKNLEIEKKYLVSRMPEKLEQYESFHIVQGYISRMPTIRIRKKNDTYWLGVKGKGHISRQEFEMKITLEEFESLSSKVDGYHVKKTRYIVPLENDLVAEVDVFEGRLQGLSVVEVEFSTESECKQFTEPDWFGKDVSLEKEYKNSHLSTLDRYIQQKI